MTDFSKMRKVWQNARDKAGIKKGVVSGLSVGDAIDKVAKAQTQGYASLFKAAQELDKSLSKYKSKVAKSNPGFVKWIDKEIGKDTANLLKAVKVDMADVKWILNYILKDGFIVGGGLWPDEGNFSNCMQLTKDENPKTWAEAMEVTGMFVPLSKIGPIILKRANNVKGMKWPAKLTGLNAHYAAFDEMANLMTSDVKLAEKWSNVQSPEDWLKYQKAVKSRKTLADSLPDARKAIKSLTG